ncbi:hypothetical protein [Paractinoplanes atraurantiacus]|uniref:Uncharacterized protein n=1 Tax=Paractinoplanes atraurantiacus TaxID=1036182 RepID=A0A285J7F3_9ACTN|nr:hypothetical protein [Actinoplanes atraurantiacus]SNY55983.1 hypothetical protein SAMN05421748_11732 [Actinoplanes atraurantiacus]
MKHLLAALDGARLHDILLPGYLDTDDGPPRFVQLMGRAYLDLGDRLLHLDGAAYEGALTLSFATKPTTSDYMAGEDEEFATASIGSLFFDTSTAPAITEVRYVTTARHGTRAPDPAPGSALVRCAEFRLRYGGRLFFDPMTFERLRMAASDGYDTWHSNDRPRDEEVFGPIQEHHWTAGTSG